MGLKIGLVTGEFPPMEGGVGAFTQELAGGLAANAPEIHIVTSKKARPQSERRSIWDIKEPYDLGYAQLHARIGRWSWTSLGTIASIAARYHLDVVNIQYQAAAFDMYIPAINFLPWRLRDVCRTVVTFHDLRYPYLFPKAGRLRKSSVYHLAGSAEGVIVTNEEDYEELRKQGVKASRLALIPIGSNIQISAPSSEDISKIRHKLGLISTDMLIGFFGFLNPSKGPDQLVQALSRLNESFHLVFIGGQIGSSDSASNRAFYDDIVGQIHMLEIADRVHWTGFLPDSDVSTYMHAADVMVQPYRDGVSLRRGTLMAVLAHGRPLITTSPKIPIAEIVHGETVWLTPIDDVTALSNAIEKVSGDPDIQALLANGAKKVSLLFSWEIITNNTMEFLEKIVTHSPD